MRLTTPASLLATVLFLTLPVGGRAQSMPAPERVPEVPPRPLNLSLPRDVPGQVRMEPREVFRLPQGAVPNGNDPQPSGRAPDMRYGIGYEARQAGALGGHGAGVGAGAGPGVGAGRGRGR